MVLVVSPLGSIVMNRALALRLAVIVLTGCCPAAFGSGSSDPVATATFVPSVDLAATTANDRGTIPDLPMNVKLPKSLSGDDDANHLRTALKVKLDKAAENDLALVYDIQVKVGGQTKISIPADTQLTVNIPKGSTVGWSNGAENSTSTTGTVLVTGLLQSTAGTDIAQLQAIPSNPPANVTTTNATSRGLVRYNIVPVLTPDDAEFAFTTSKTLTNAYTTGGISTVFPAGSSDALTANETAGGTMQVTGNATVPTGARNNYQYSTITKDGTVTTGCAAGGKDDGPASYSTGVGADHMLKITFKTLPDATQTGMGITIDFDLKRPLLIKSAALTTNLLGGASIGISYGIFSIGAGASSASVGIAGGNHDMQYTTPGGTGMPYASGTIPGGQDGNAQADNAPGETDTFSNTEVLSIKTLGTKVDSETGKFRSALSIAAERHVGITFSAGAAVYAKADMPTCVITACTIASLP